MCRLMPCGEALSRAGLFIATLPRSGLHPKARSIALDGTDKNWVPNPNPILTSITVLIKILEIKRIGKNMNHAL